MEPQIYRPDVYNPEGQAIVAGGGGGSSTFLGLTDTPSTYTGQAGKVPVVNGGESALVFQTISGGSGNFLVAVTDPVSLISTGVAKVKFPWPYSGATINQIDVLMAEAPAGQAAQFDVNNAGTTILGGSTLNCAAGATSGSISSLSVTPTIGDVISVDIDQVGNTSAGRGAVLLFRVS